MTNTVRARQDLDFVTARIRASGAAGGFGDIAPMALPYLPMIAPHPAYRPGEWSDAELAPELLDRIHFSVDELYSPRGPFLPGEFPIEALWVRYAALYVGEVYNGGHDSLADVLPHGAITLRLCRSGSIAAGFPAVAAVLDLYIGVVGDPDSASSPLRTGASSPRRKVLEDLDRRLFALDRTAFSNALAALGRTIPVEIVEPAGGEDRHAAHQRRVMSLADALPMCMARRDHLRAVGLFESVDRLETY